MEQATAAAAAGLPGYGDSLTTLDHRVAGELLRKPAFGNSMPQLHSVMLNREFPVVVVDNFLPVEDCAEIREVVSTKTGSYPYLYRHWVDMGTKYKPEQRTGKRLLVDDPKFAQLVWSRLQKVAELHPSVNSVLQEGVPYGFGIPENAEWEPTGINPVFRVCSYVATNKDINGEHFEVHRDAQYCGSACERSVFTMLMYLNTVPQSLETSEATPLQNNGTTALYHPPDDQPTPTVQIGEKGVTMEEELEQLNVKELFTANHIHPVEGRMLLFKHGMLHAAKPLVIPDGCESIDRVEKLVIRTDVVFRWRRHPRSSSQQQQPTRFPLPVWYSHHEAKWYARALALFREAQNAELDQNVEKSSELYERSLSIRQAFGPGRLQGVCLSPICDVTSIVGFDMVELCLMWRKLPVCVLHQMFSFLGTRDLDSISMTSKEMLGVCKEFPKIMLREAQTLADAIHVKTKTTSRTTGPLRKFLFKRAWFDGLCTIEEARQTFVPKVMLRNGLEIKMRFPDASFVKDNQDRCARVAAMMAIISFGHKLDCGWYVVEYDPLHGRALAVPVEKVLAAVFFDMPCDGQFYHLEPKVYDSSSDGGDSEEDLDSNWHNNREVEISPQILRANIERRLASDWIQADYAANDLQDTVGKCVDMIGFVKGTGDGRFPDYSPEDLEEINFSEEDLNKVFELHDVESETLLAPYDFGGEYLPITNHSVASHRKTDILMENCRNDHMPAVLDNVGDELEEEFEREDFAISGLQNSVLGYRKSYVKALNEMRDKACAFSIDMEARHTHENQCWPCVCPIRGTNKGSTSTHGLVLRNNRIFDFGRGTLRCTQKNEKVVNSTDEDPGELQLATEYVFELAMLPNLQFNHASCNCGAPGHGLTEQYTNIYNLYLNQVSVTLLPENKNGDILANALYAGVNL